MFKQGSDLRQFADAKVDKLRAGLATAVENEANLREALELGNQRLSEQTNGLRRCKMQNAYISYCNRSTRFDAML